MKIVVCDDNKVFVNQLVSELEFIFAKKGYGIEVKSYQDPMKLIHEDGDRVDAYFLDIEMPEMDGIELAQFLRKQRESEFIFVSVHDELWRRTMKVKPIAFIRKNMLEADLEEAVEDFLKEHFRKKKTVILKDGKRPVSVMIDQVVYFSSDKDYVVIHFLDGEEKILRQKLSVVEDEVNAYGFLRIHNRYLVNMRRVCKVHNFKNKTSSALEMSGSIFLPISKKYLSYVKAVFLDWFHRNDT